MYPNILQSRLAECLIVLNMRAISKSFLVIGPQRFRVVVPVLINISRWRIGRYDDMGILIVASVAGLKTALDIGSGTSMLACMGKHIPQLHISQMHRVSWLT